MPTPCPTPSSGAIYTYDRLPFDFLGADGKITVTPAVRTIQNNMIFANYGSAWPIDHDDGSSYYVDRENVLLYAGTKSYLGGHNVSTTDSLLLWPNLNGWGAATMLYQSVTNASGYAEVWENNTVVLGAAMGPSRGPGYVDFNPCDAQHTVPNATHPAPAMVGNTIHIPSGTDPSRFTVGCGPKPLLFSAWQGLGHDHGTSVLSGSPTTTDLVLRASCLLRM